MKKETLQRYIEQLTASIAKLTTKLLDDFNYSFEWGVAGQIYYENHKKELLERMQKEWNETDETDDEFLKRFKRQIMEEILNTSPLGNSTNENSNLAKKLRIEAMQHMITRYGIFAEIP